MEEAMANLHNGTISLSMESPCELGKHSYWEEAYDQELKNFEDFGDEGEVWYKPVFNIPLQSLAF